MQVLLLRLKAPLMSFGDVDVSEEFGPTMRHPAKSMIAGLIANAMGGHHTSPELTQKIQDTIEIASLELTRGKLVTDEQASQLDAKSIAFTTDGAGMERSGHEYSYRGSLRRKKEYLAGADYLVAVAASPELLAEMAEALRTTARPLFIGRRCCLPTRKVFHGLTQAESLVAALRADRIAEERSNGRKLHLRWSGEQAGAPAGTSAMALMVSDLRDWKTRLHGGSRPVFEGEIA